MNRVKLTADAAELISNCELIIMAMPSAFAATLLEGLPEGILKGKKILSAIKGILPDENKLLNDHLADRFGLVREDYFAVLGPCHAEEVAAEKLSYLTFAGIDEDITARIASLFRNNHIRTILNPDIYGVQYASVLKNIYAVGSGIAHGLEYGDNFQSVLIANSADEMAGFLRKAGIVNAVVGYLEHVPEEVHVAKNNYAASVYLGDLLVTCYSLYSRNRTFGNMIGKGYTVQAAKLEMNMVAEGYLASRGMHGINKNVGAEMPIAETIYRILWEKLPPREGFRFIESVLI
jgi:glycerol-3-phosphate dehydrogenase (NAD(P)+)